jgi:hypothetical protein
VSVCSLPSSSHPARIRLSAADPRATRGVVNLKSRTRPTSGKVGAGSEYGSGRAEVFEPSLRVHLLWDCAVSAASRSADKPAKPLSSDIAALERRPFISGQEPGEQRFMLSPSLSREVVRLNDVVVPRLERPTELVLCVPELGMRQPCRGAHLRALIAPTHDVLAAAGDDRADDDAYKPEDCLSQEQYLGAGVGGFSARCRLSGSGSSERRASRAQVAAACCQILRGVVRRQSLRYPGEVLGPVGPHPSDLENRA